MAEAASLYAERVKVYPQRIAGRFRTIKWVVLIALLSIYYLAPWLRWDRGPNAPDQALLVDMAGRRAYFFWIEIWPQEVYYLTGLLILGAIGLFLVTSVAGRVWCGFTCPQTVWTDLYLLVERWIEGDRNRRIKLDQESWSMRKLGLKLAKHAVWLLIAFATGGAWIMYFNDAPTVVREIFTGQASSAVYGFTALFTATTYLLAGWAREQVCIYMCPWPRFQGAMFDEHTLIVTYADWRGEKRGHAKRNEDFSKRGHCIDCGLCVHVCPTGIDIRNGQQLACIGCGLCVDACNSVMPKVGLPQDLIAYDSLWNQALKAKGDKAPAWRLLRPRTFIYAAIFVAVAALMMVGLATRSHLDVTLLADRAPLFVKLSNGDIQNGYSIKISNKLREPASYQIRIDGIDGLSFKLVGHTNDVVEVPGDSVGTFRLLARAPRSAIEERSNSIQVTIQDTVSKEESRHDAIFSGPGNSTDGN
ncbi:MAG TPA: cytochrome c oxidase accessory protein CcoG [Dongiaceae bacterium]|nr:cytochrome c oxidase accessory protein CcoG [Dongiaceae bacterium]